MAFAGKLIHPLLVSFLALAGCSSLDGPTGPFPGGVLRSGEFVSQLGIDWAAIEAATKPPLLELQVVEPPGSRTTGFLVYENQLYIPCDRGFIWRRTPAPPRWLLSLMHRAKQWHEDVLADGRVVVRVDGNRYALLAVRVSDPALQAELQSMVEQAATEMLGAPLGEVPSDSPNDIWFFRLEPRRTTQSVRSAESAVGARQPPT